MSCVETQSTKSDTLRETAARIAVTRGVLQHIKSRRTVDRKTNCQFADRIHVDDYVTNLCEAGLIRHFGNAQYCITLKGLRFLDAAEVFERSAEQSPGSAVSFFADAAM